MENIRQLIRTHCDVLAAILLIALFGCPQVGRTVAGKIATVRMEAMQLESAPVFSFRSPICPELSPFAFPHVESAIDKASREIGRVRPEQMDRVILVRY